jgi:hypothetical protein
MSKTVQWIFSVLLASSVMTHAYAQSKSSALSDPGTPTTLINAVHGQSTVDCGRGLQCVDPFMAYHADLTDNLSTSETPWIDTSTHLITISKIPYVDGSYSASDYDSAGSVFEMTVNTTKGTRSFMGNGLPTTPMGKFPVQPGTRAHSSYVGLPARDSNHGGHYNSAADIGISPYELISTIPLEPVATGYYPIMSLITGITLTGAVWHLEIAPDANNNWFNPVNILPHDQCWGHPYSQQYHHHGYSWKCFPNQGNSGQSPVFGFALDGFPITGPRAADGHMMTNAELDQCHGTTSEITMPDGTLKTTYHYVLNREYPYSVGCFRGKVNYYQALGSDDMRQTTMPVYLNDFYP